MFLSKSAFEQDGGISDSSEEEIKYELTQALADQKA